MNNKTAIITGSNRGIGKEMVKEFAEAGYDIWACARKEDEEFESELKSLAEKYHNDIKPIYFDLNNEEEIRKGIKQILVEKRNIDVLINNAGVAFGGLFVMTPIEKMKEVYQVNVFSQVLIMQLVTRCMMRQKSGCIINMCSVGGIETSPGYLAYGSSKAALIWITKALSKEVGNYNIRVNGIAPGLIDTDMGRYKSEEEIKAVLDRTSLHRIGSTKEIAKAAIYLASDEAKYMTGHIMVIDGGRI